MCRVSEENTSLKFPVKERETRKKFILARSKEREEQPDRM